MALTYQQTENVTLSRRDGEQLTRLHPSTTGAHVALTVRNGIENDSLQAELEAVRAKMGGLLTEVSAMQYKGVVHADGDLPTTYEPGWLWKVGTAGTYKGKTCEAGDMLVANTGRAGTDNADTDFDVIQGNAERPVSGPESATADNVAVFGNAEGTSLDDGGVTVSELEEMIGASQREWIVYSAALPETMPEELADGGLLVSKSTPPGESEEPEEPGEGDMPAYDSETVKGVSASSSTEMRDTFTVPEGVTEVLALVISPGGTGSKSTCAGGAGGWAAAARVKVTPGEEIELYAEDPVQPAGTSYFGPYLSGSALSGLTFGEGATELWRCQAGSGGSGASGYAGGRGGGFACSTSEEWLALALNGPETPPKNGFRGTGIKDGSSGDDVGDHPTLCYGYGGPGPGRIENTSLKYGGPGKVTVWWVNPA